MGWLDDWEETLGGFASGVAKGIGVIRPALPSSEDTANALMVGAPGINIGFGRSTTPGDRNAIWGLPWHNKAPVQDTVEQKTVDPYAGKGKNFARDSGFKAFSAKAEWTAGSSTLAQLEHERGVMKARRDAAVRAAGRGAGAGYSAAINRLDTEIGKAQDYLGRLGPLFDQKSANQKVAWDNADVELQVSADEALAKMGQINTQTFEALKNTWSSAQSSAASVLSKIGADEATMAAVAEEVGRFEDEIMDMNEVDATSRARILQATEDLAVASARSAGATSQLDLVRNKIMVEGDVKEKINGMIEDRKQQVAARNAAVSAARALEAARWPADQPMDRNGFSSKATSDVIRQLMGSAPDAVRGQVEGLVGLFSSYGVRNSDIPKLLAGNASVATRYGLSPDVVDFGALPPRVLAYAKRVLPVALDTYKSSGSWYDDNVNGKKPWELPAGSAVQAMAAADQLGLSDPEDRMYSGREYADMAEQGKDLTKINDMMGR